MAVCDISKRHCMLRSCEKCPGVQKIREHLMSVFTANEQELDDNISYKQWVRNESGQTTLETLSCTVENFIDKFCSVYEALLSHQFITKAQAQHLRNLKETISDSSTGLLLLDFAENYSFVVQDAVQGHHWDNSQATLHPFVIYYIVDDKLNVSNMCVISDCMNHETNTVHAFLEVVIKHIKTVMPTLTDIQYFSDGAASQYKNYKNLVNLCCHKDDFGIPAQWNFFATSHGKSPCDGIGGTVKRLVARASLQATISGQILTPLEMHDWCVINVKGIKLFYVSATDVINSCERFKLEERYSHVSTVPGTRSHHSFVPVGDMKLEIRRISVDTIFKTVQMGGLQGIKPQHDSAFEVGKYVACMYDEDWYIGIVEDRSDEQHDLLVNFMQKGATEQSLSWPRNRDICWIPFQDVICTVDVPSAQGASGRQYFLSNSDLRRVQGAQYCEKS